jgi:YidC/Oxa1 family membrane protein insertase
VRNKVIVAISALLALAVVVSFFFNAKTADKELKKEETPLAQPAAKPPLNPNQPLAATLPANPAPSASTPSTQPASTQASTTPTAPTPAPARTYASNPYKAKPFTQARIATIGSNDKTTGFNLQVELSAWGASVLHATASRYTNEVIGGHPYDLQKYQTIETVTGKQYFMPFAARAIYIDGQPVDLSGVRWELVSPSSNYRLTLEAPKPATQAASQPAATLENKAVYTLTIVDDKDQPVLKLTRTWTVAKDSYQIQLQQDVQNLSGRDLNIVWQQYAMGDLPQETAYMGDRRLDVVGYFNVSYNPTRQFIYTTGDTISRDAGIKEFLNTNSRTHALWPLAAGPKDTEMVWLAYRNRYFASSVYRPIDDANLGKPGTHLDQLDKIFPVVGLDVIGQYPPADAHFDSSSAFLTLQSAPIALPSGQSKNLDLTVYAGPLDPTVLAAAPYKQLGFSDMIIYSLGGFCSFCTFQWLAHLLLNFLYLIHAVTGDWGIAIIVLVLVVRLILHPITKRSQINMAKMGKQMAAIQPELEKIKKKYANDPTAQNAETLKLYRERNINPLNMLGCAPMFLQMPIWIALYAMLYFAIELRHAPAFWGLFQAINPNWHFFADLSSPDRLLVFWPESHFINLLFIKLDYSSFNIMPILMGVVFIVNQKLTAPPATTDTAKQQQNIMLFVTILFPFMLYSAPSGLTLYIFASTAAGIVDSLIVKRHIAREEAAGTLFKVDPNKKPGFMSVLAKLVEAQQAKLENAQSEQEKKKNNK